MANTFRLLALALFCGVVKCHLNAPVEAPVNGEHDVSLPNVSSNKETIHFGDYKPTQHQINVAKQTIADEDSRETMKKLVDILRQSTSDDSSPETIEEYTDKFDNEPVADAAFSTDDKEVEAVDGLEETREEATPIADIHPQEPTINNHPQEPTTNNHLQEPTTNNHLQEPTTNNHLQQPVTEGVHKEMVNEVKEPVTNNHLQESTTNNHLPEPITNIHPQEPITNNHLPEPTTNNHQQEIHIHEQHNVDHHQTVQHMAASVHPHVGIKDLEKTSELGALGVVKSLCDLLMRSPEYINLCKDPAVQEIIRNHPNILEEQYHVKIFGQHKELNSGDVVSDLKDNHTVDQSMRYVIAKICVGPLPAACQKVVAQV
ncbi:selenocysteine-specific elongation factor selB, putative [Babesia ovis]|uniref:Selenocysteine-specific elongation factor selB, putative n=1 Tax=Babesia ovis TaxID=5869 RepID=A0A9W5WW50_BABOV|nr:selenocysteine-specific elongation factor selB, putative [Babesia ovis]